LKFYSSISKVEISKIVETSKSGDEAEIKYKNLVKDIFDSVYRNDNKGA
tara:strand:- start:593 stop:739 length:147 start_codon:yes stop_codon:yes gene_type:complete